MPDLTNLSPAFDPKKATCLAIIETPKGSRNKFSYDPETGLFKLAGLLPEGMFFPFDFGFVPSTLGDDGDPLDVLLLMDAPAYPGCIVPSRLIGVIEAEQIEKGKKERNDRLLAVASNSAVHRSTRDVRDLSADLMHQIEHFFVSYNEMRGKKFTPTGRKGPQAARNIVTKAATPTRR